MRRGPLLSVGTVGACPTSVTESSGALVSGDDVSSPAQAAANRIVAARGSAADLQGRNMVGEHTVGLHPNVVTSSVADVDEMIAKSRFLFGLDEPPDDIEGFFVAEAVAEEDSLDDDEDDDEAQRTAGMRAVAASLMLHEGSPVFWETAQRLVDAGLDRRDALGQMAYALRRGLNDQNRDDIDQLPEFLTSGVADYLADLPLPDEATVADAILGVVAAEQGITLGPLVERATAVLAPPPGGRVMRHIVAEQVSDQLDEYGDLSMLPDDRLVYPLKLGATVVLTHRLTEAEIESDCLHGIASDLGVFALEPDPRHPDGGPLEPMVERGDIWWSGPDGWLSGFAPGDLVAVRMDGEGVVTLAPADEPAPAPSLAAGLRTVFERFVEPEPTAIPVPMVLSALVLDEPRAFATPQVPLTELLAEVGLSIQAGRVGAEAAHFAAAEAQERSLRMHEAAEGDCSIADPAIDAFKLLTDADAAAADIRHALRDIADGTVLDAPGDIKPRDLVVDELVPEDDPHVDTATARAVAERAVAAARRSDEVAVAHWLAGMIAERTGDLATAEKEFHASMVADVGFEAAIDRCAWYASDRGDAATAARLWRSLESGFEGDLETVERYAQPSGARLGRNDPCWCGSGRKFKACHQGRQANVALPDRVAWLCRKAVSYALRRGGDAKADLVGNFLALAGSDRASLDEQSIARVAGDPLAIDAMLHEGGWFARFLDERGSLLPDDEQLLAASWLLVERSVYEVVRIEHGVGIEMRDLRTGDVVMVTEKLLGTRATPGMQFCCRVVPDGAGHQIIGGVFPVRVGDEQAVLAICERGDPVELCGWAGALLRPPGFQNREGEALIDGIAVFRVVDAAEARWVLDGLYEPSGGGWQEMYALHEDERVVRATLSLDGDELAITANSHERLDRMIEAVRRELPDASLIRDERTAADLAQMTRSGAGTRLADLAGTAELPDLPEGALAEIQERMEQRWLTEPVPALGGRTPIAAAADPTRRRDVERLLDTFPTFDDDAGAIGLRPEKLREALGL
jgi:hypothetical protein